MESGSAQVQIFLVACIEQSPNSGSGEVQILLAACVQQSLKPGSAQVQILLLVCWRFASVKTSDSGPGWK